MRRKKNGIVCGNTLRKCPILDVNLCVQMFPYLIKRGERGFCFNSAGVFYSMNKRKRWEIFEDDLEIDEGVDEKVSIFDFDFDVENEFRFIFHQNKDNKCHNDHDYPNDVLVVHEDILGWGGYRNCTEVEFKTRNGDGFPTDYFTTKLNKDRPNRVFVCFVQRPGNKKKFFRQSRYNFSKHDRENDRKKDALFLIKDLYLRGTR